MKILLIAANQRAQGEPTLGLGYLASYLRKYMPDEDLDIRILNYIPKDLSRIASFAPDIIGISAMTIQFRTAVELAKRLREQTNAVLVLGGVHITLAPQSLDETFDIAVVGEGEQTFMEVVQSIQNHGLDKQRLKDIPGVMFTHEGKVVKGPAREFIKPLDAIPQPARDLFNMEFFFNPAKNVFGQTQGRGTQLFTSRGCPFTCSFCSCSAVWSRTRYHSAEYVADEMSLLIDRYHVNHIRVHDDLFAVNPRRLRKLADALEARNIPEKVSLGVYGRADVFNEEMCRLLKRINTRFVEFGIESGSQRVLDILKVGRLKLHHVENAVRLCKEHGFQVGGLFMTGVPGETEEEMFQTLDFIRKLELDKFMMSVFTPFPGTPMWEQGVDKGAISTSVSEINWDAFKLSRKDSLKLDDIVPGGPQIYVNHAVSPERFMEIYQLFEQERQKTATSDWAKLFPEEEPLGPEWLS